MNNNQPRQTDNKAFVVGFLKEKKIEFKPSKASGRLMASGFLTVVTNTPVGVGEVKVRVQQFADKKDGTPNTLFKGLQTVANTYKSIAEVGEAEADLIKIEGSLEDNCYYSVNKGEFVEKLEIKGTFISRLMDRNTPHCCKVGFEGYLSKVTPKNDELEVELIGIGYNSVAVPVVATVPNTLVAPFQGRYQVGCTATLNIAIINEVQTQAVQAEVAFGEGLGEVIEKHITKRVIFGGGNPIYAGGANAVSEEIVKQGLAIRQSNLDTKKSEAEAKSNSGANMNTGFGGATTGAPAPNNFGAMGGNFNGGFPMGGGFPTN